MVHILKIDLKVILCWWTEYTCYYLLLLDLNLKYQYTKFFSMTSLCSLGDLFHICFIDTDEILFLNIYMNSVLKLVFIVIMKIFYTFTLMCLPIKICIILCIRKILLKKQDISNCLFLLNILLYRSTHADICRCH